MVKSILAEKLDKGILIPVPEVFRKELYQSDLKLFDDYVMAQSTIGKVTADKIEQAKTLI